jgi:DNA-binding MarR family transcriptional regulator
VLKTTTSRTTAPHGAEAGAQIDRIESALQVIGRSFTQVRLHERLLQDAGVRLDRAGAGLISKLSAAGEAQRITTLAEQLGVDAPTVTRKIQQLEREGFVTRHPDPDDKRATRISITPTGKRTFERVLKARRAWLDHLLEGWEPNELEEFAGLLGKFSDALAHQMEEHRGNN